VHQREGVTTDQQDCRCAERMAWHRFLVFAVAFVTAAAVLAAGDASTPKSTCRLKLVGACGARNSSLGDLQLSLSCNST